MRVLGAVAVVDDRNAVAWLARQEVSSVTLTVTEKGCCHTPATGRLDAAHPGVMADLAGRLWQPQTVPGVLLAAPAARWAARAVNLVRCGKIAGNGTLLRAVVIGLASGVMRGMVAWIEDHVSFPRTMVDRIVPATTGAEMAAVAVRLGMADAAPVRGEAFRQWVIEDDFRSARPPWEAVGAEIVGDVAAHEMVRMHVLNGAQPMLALLGALRGHAFTHEAVADAGLAAFVTAVLREETLPHLPQAAGMVHEPYLAQAMGRTANRAINHRCHQIATDMSQKLRQRVLDPMRARRAVGLAAAGLETALANLRAGRWEVSDPVAAEVAGIVRRAQGDPGAFVAGVLTAKVALLLETRAGRAVRCRFRWRISISGKWKIFAGSVDGWQSGQG